MLHFCLVSGECTDRIWMYVNSHGEEYIHELIDLTDGRVVCLESNCNRTTIPLTKRVGAPDGGMSEGIGGLSAYRVS